jgi:hypothetical protein
MDIAADVKNNSLDLTNLRFDLIEETNYLFLSPCIHSKSKGMTTLVTNLLNERPQGLLVSSSHTDRITLLGKASSYCRSCGVTSADYAADT